MKVIVTGSRDWSLYGPVGLTLDEKLDEADNAQEPFFLLVGDCKTGADMDAASWWRWQRNWGNVAPDSLKIFEADWTKYGKAAGPIRNAEMVDEGADYFLAFRLNGSKGTTDCIERCKYAEIPGRIYDLTITEV